MSNLGHAFSLLKPTAHCDNCASDFNKRFAIGRRVYAERVWLCSPSCYRALVTKWKPTPAKGNRGVLALVSCLFSKESN